MYFKPHTVPDKLEGKKISVQLVQNQAAYTF